MECPTLNAAPQHLDTPKGNARDDGYPKVLNLKGLEDRPRFSSVSTMAPGSSCLSFTASPYVSPRHRFESLDTAAPFMLPAAEESADMADVPVSRLISPVHKGSRLQHVDEASDEDKQTPPRTPREKQVQRRGSPPPLIPKAKHACPPLMQALRSKSEDQVRSVLLQNPDAASDLFWDHDSEPPLCYAVRNQCSTSIVRLLLEKGAAKDVEDKHLRTPAQIVEEFNPPVSPTVNYALMWDQLLPGNGTQIQPSFPYGFAPGARPKSACAFEAWRLEVTDLLKV